MCLPPQLLGLAAIGKARQDRCPRHDAIGTAPGDLDGVVDRLGDIGEKCRHLGLALEAMFRCQPPPVFRYQHFALGDADQRVMRHIVIGLCEIAFVRRHQWHAEPIGQRDQSGFRLAFRSHAMALQLDIEPVAEHRLQLLDQCGGLGALSAHQRLVDGASRPPRQADQARAVGGKIVPRDMMFGIVGRFEIGPARQFHQVAVALFVFGQEGQRRNAPQARRRFQSALFWRHEIGLQGTADDRLDALLRHGIGKFQRAEKIAGVGDRHRRHQRIPGQLRQRLDLQRPLRQRIGRVVAQMDEGQRD